MKTVTLTSARRRLHSIVEAARHFGPVTLSNHGKTVAFVVGNPLDMEELLSDLTSVREAKEDVRRHGTFPAEEVVGRERWKRAMKNALPR